MYTNRQGVDTAGHNIANAQTEGFSRQRVNVTAHDPLESHGVLIGNGVYMQSITRTHDQYIEKQVNQATQESSMGAAKREALEPLEQIYATDSAASIADEISNFFSALQTFSSSPDEVPVRTNLREAGKSLASAFQRVDNSLLQRRADLNDQIEGTVTEVGDLCKRIAELNVAIGTQEAGKTDTANDLRDKQDALVRQLSDRIDISYYKNQNGLLCVRGPSQALMVDGKYFARTECSKNPNDGTSRILVFENETPGSPGRDITHTIEKGKLRALIEVRDKVVPGLIDSNNALAHQLASSVNEVHRQGFGIGDYSETMGRNFFADTDLDSAARFFQIDDAIAEDINAIAAAASPGAMGDNVIANNMLRLRNDGLMGGGAMNFNQFYSNYVGSLGLEIERTINHSEASKIMLSDLVKRREAISGVSLDEEAVNLLRWQTAFAASSKVITTTDEMLETVLSLKR